MATRERQLEQGETLFREKPTLMRQQAEHVHELNELERGVGQLEWLVGRFDSHTNHR